MTTSYGLHGYFTAQAGRGDALADRLLEAATVLGDNSDCRLYMISRAPDDADRVWVTEAWTSREAHAASLGDDRVRGLIQRAMPLIAGSSDSIELTPLGGKGLTLDP